MREDVLSTHAMYAIFSAKGELLGVQSDFPEVDSFLNERVSKVQEGKLERLKLARLSLSSHELAKILMGQASLDVGEGADIVVLSSGWFAKPEFSAWYHKVPKTTVSEVSAGKTA